MRIPSCRLPTALAALVSLLMAAPVQALYLNLTDEQINQAVAHGKATFEEWKKGPRPIDDLDPEYVVDLGDDKGRALVFTEFGTLALETRRYLAIGRPLPRPEIDRVLSEVRNKLEFVVIAVGGTRNFMETSKVTLQDTKTRHQPDQWRVTRGAPREGAAERFVASGRYTFDLRAVDVSSPATLMVQTPDGQELRFEFDFSKLR